MIELVAPDGVTIALRGARQGEHYVIPPILDDLEPAEAGDCRLSSTGEVVTDPDHATTFTITPSQKPLNPRPDTGTPRIATSGRRTYMHIAVGISEGA